MSSHVIKPVKPRDLCKCEPEIFRSIKDALKKEIISRPYSSKTY